MIVHHSIDVNKARGDGGAELLEGQRLMKSHGIFGYEFDRVFASIQWLIVNSFAFQLQFSLHPVLGLLIVFGCPA